MAFPGFALEFTIVHRVLLWPLSLLWFAAAEAERSVLCARFLAGLVASSFAGWPVARVVVSGMSPVTRPWSVRLDSSALSSSRLRCHLVFIITCVMLFCYFSDVSLTSARLSWASSWASSVLVLMSGCTAVAVAAPSACIVSAVWPLCYCGGLWRACRAQVHARILSFWDAACVRGVPWMRVSHLVIQDWFMCIFVDLMCCLCLLGVPCRHAAAVRRLFRRLVSRFLMPCALWLCAAVHPWAFVSARARLVGRLPPLQPRRSGHGFGDYFILFFLRLARGVALRL